MANKAFEQQASALQQEAKRLQEAGCDDAATIYRDRVAALVDTYRDQLWANMGR